MTYTAVEERCNLIQHTLEAVMMAVPSRLGLASRNAGSESAALEKGRVWRGFGRKLIETNEKQAR